MKIIFIQGPPRSGKDSFASILENCLCREHNNLNIARIYKFAEPLRSMVRAVLGPGVDIESIKDKSMKDFLPYMEDPHRVRDFMIAFSEDFMKPRYGPSIFGEILKTKIIGAGKFSLEYAIISDSGFSGEADPLRDYFGPENCIIVQMSREGCGFDNDSRSYWDLKGMKIYTFHNHNGQDWKYHMRQFAKIIIEVIDEEDS